MSGFLLIAATLCLFWVANRSFAIELRQAQCPHPELWHLKDELNRTRGLKCLECGLVLDGSNP